MNPKFFDIYIYISKSIGPQRDLAWKCCGKTKWFLKGNKSLCEPIHFEIFTFSLLRPTKKKEFFLHTHTHKHTHTHIYIYIYIDIYDSLNTLSGGKSCLVAPGVAVPPWAIETVLSLMDGGWWGHGIAHAFTRCMMKIRLSGKQDGSLERQGDSPESWSDKYG